MNFGQSNTENGQKMADGRLLFLALEQSCIHVQLYANYQGEIQARKDDIVASVGNPHFDLEQINMEFPLF